MEQINFMKMFMAMTDIASETRELTTIKSA